MASQFMSGALSGNSNSLDVPVAALAGLSVAFAAFAAPADLLGELVAASGLSSFFPAVEPPLDLRARLGIGAVGAVLVFVVAFVLLRWLDRFGRQPRSLGDAELDFDLPRLRRRDSHPDAAPRPPLFASLELSEPQTAETKEHKRPAEPPAEMEPKCEPAPILPSWLPEEVQSIGEKPAPGAGQALPQHGSVQGHSIAELLDRLEHGLARRRGEAVAVAVAAAPDPAPQPEGQFIGPAIEPRQAFPSASDDRLQSAIDSLQRLASRHD